MPQNVPEELSRTIETLYRSESGRILATLGRLLGDLDVAEEAMHEAFAAALDTWPQAGVPDKPRPWLISTARFKAINGMRRRARFDSAQKDLALYLEALNEPARRIPLLAPNKRRRAMKYICLGYIEPGKFEGMTEDERHAVLDECFEHNDHLRANGHLVAEVALQPPETALTLYWKNGKVATTDGPYAETKEQLGGIQILEARDLNHAIQLISQLPGFKYGLGPIEIRPAADLNEMMKESEQRRRKNTARESQPSKGFEATN